MPVPSVAVSLFFVVMPRVRFVVFFSRYSTTSVYTELRYGTGEGDDGSRLLTIENHLGVPVTVSLEHTDGAGEDALETSSSRGLHFGRKLK